eukprot:jgi/Mesen1/1295/ME000013S00790
MRRLDDPMVCRLLDPVEFDPEKLKVTFVDALNPADVGHPEQLIPRHYTLTHNDVTAELHLTIGSSFNSRQLVGWYTRLLRDDVKAEWKIHGSEPGHLALHVHCHVSGGHPLMAPAALRNWIFEREMPLVLQAFRHGDRELLAMHPELDMATVWIHYHSCDSKYNRADCWGPLCLAANSLRSPMLGSLRVDYAKSLDDVEQVLPLSALYWHAEKSIQPSKRERRCIVQVSGAAVDFLSKFGWARGEAEEAEKTGKQLGEAEAMSWRDVQVVCKLPGAAFPQSGRFLRGGEHKDHNIGQFKEVAAGSSFCFGSYSGSSTMQEKDRPHGNLGAACYGVAGRGRSRCLRVRTKCFHMAIPYR